MKTQKLNSDSLPDPLLSNISQEIAELYFENRIIPLIETIVEGFCLSYVKNGSDRRMELFTLF
jgi:hypothetical protein